MAISMLMFFAAPAWSGSAIHIYHCFQEDEAADEELEEIASEWLAAARKLNEPKTRRVS